MTASYSQPRVSIVMPIYNVARFLEEAVQSIICQSFSDFELVVIDDGSTDESQSVLQRTVDRRVSVYRNERNCGVSASLNRGIDLARGEYIARMDGDDISLPRRLEKQVNFLDAHPEVSVVGVKSCLIDTEGSDSGLWKSDRDTVSSAQILAMLPVRNCIAHPGVMMRRDVAVEYRYRVEHSYSEDYDLWLRLAATGHRLEKLDEVLLKYRVHPSSVTARSNRKVGGDKNIRTKVLFLIDHVRKGLPLNGFVCRVAAQTALECAHNGSERIRDAAHSFARKLLRQTGRCLGAVSKSTNPSGLFFFFPFYHVGGAERVHADIISAVADRQPWIFFTDRSKNSAFKALFRGKGKLIDLFPFVGNVFTKHITSGIIISLINRHPGSTVYGVNSLFFYDLLPFLSPDIRCIDMLHAFGSDLEDASLPHVDRLDQRVVITAKTVNDFRRQYRDHDVPLEFLDRVVTIPNKVDLPLTTREKGGDEKIHVVFVGRDAREKRVCLAATVAKVCKERKIDADFTFVGDFSPHLRETFAESCTFTGEIAAQEKMAGIYDIADILLLTSSSEGFPLVVMEAMAHGVVPLCTDVGGISMHIANGTNGFLVPDLLDEAAITATFVEMIMMLSRDRAKLRATSDAARRYCIGCFSGADFCRSYRRLLRLPDMPESENL